jgi:hypothetical protein
MNIQTLVKAFFIAVIVGILSMAIIAISGATNQLLAYIPPALMFLTFAGAVVVVKR